MTFIAFSRSCPPIAAAFLLAACSSTPDAGEVATDTIGLARDRPGSLVLEDESQTAATPYGGEGARVSCANAARDIVRLTALLGPDLEAATGASGPQSDEAGALGRTRDFASNLSDDLPDMASDAAVDAVVGLNPARPVVRFFSQAGEAEAAARRERELALKRRAWLRGAFDALQCDHDLLDEAVAREGLRGAEGDTGDDLADDDGAERTVVLRLDEVDTETPD